MEITIKMAGPTYLDHKIVLCVDSDYELRTILRDDEYNFINLYKGSPAVYFLFGPKCLHQQIYIGLTSDIYKRYKLHLVGKDFWEEIVFISKISRPFTKTELVWLESLFILQVVENNYYDFIQNYLIPTNVVIDEKDRPELRECFEEIKLLLEVVNRPIINPNIILKETKGTSKTIIDRIAKAYKYLPNIEQMEEYNDESILYHGGQYLVMSDGKVMILEGSKLAGNGLDRYKEKMNNNILTTYVIVENEEQAKLIIG